ncbi:hypothetical protein SSBG_02787 [Streptomyces sp. SPB074]|nr:hypothetical protein SSBG_02787 [Streptomyces sp. SPB074]
MGDGVEAVGEAGLGGGTGVSADRDREEVCVRCAELRRQEVVAESVGDYSRATDCRVLIKRHPHEGGG